MGHEKACARECQFSSLIQLRARVLGALWRRMQEVASKEGQGGKLRAPGDDPQQIVTREPLHARRQGIPLPGQGVHADCRLSGGGAVELAHAAADT